MQGALVLHVLFRFGANVLLQNKAGLTPCGIAEEMGMSHLVVLLKEYERNLTSRLSRMSIRIEGKDRPSPRSAGKLRVRHEQWCCRDRDGDVDG